MTNELYVDYVAAKQGILDAKDASLIDDVQFDAIDYAMRRTQSRSKNGRLTFELSDFLERLSFQLHVLQIEEDNWRFVLVKLFESLASGVWVGREMPDKTDNFEVPANLKTFTGL